MRAFIEQIEGGHGEIKLPFGIILKETPDQLDISNGKGEDLGILNFISILMGYKQIGTFKVKRPHKFKEREWVYITIKNDKIIRVRKVTNTRSKRDKK